MGRIDVDDVMGNPPCGSTCHDVISILCTRYGTLQLINQIREMHQPYITPLITHVL